MSLRFLATNSTKGNPSWWLLAANNEQVAWAGEIFSSLSNATRAAADFKSSSINADYEVYQGSDAKWRWRASVSSDKVASSGESFDSKWNAERAAQNVRDNARFADGP